MLLIQCWPSSVEPLLLYLLLWVGGNGELWWLPLRDLLPKRTLWGLSVFCMDLQKLLRTVLKSGQPCRRPLPPFRHTLSLFSTCCVLPALPPSVLYAERWAIGSGP